jgi:hypothetical protein
VFLRGWNVVIFLVEVLIVVLDQILPEKQFQHYCSVNGGRPRTWSLGGWSPGIRFLLSWSRVAGCSVQPFSVDLVQIQPEERLGLTAKSNWAEALIKREYAVKSSVAVTGCWRDREKITCVKRVEVKKEIIMRRMVRVKCEEKAKGKEECLIGCELSEISL